MKLTPIDIYDKEGNLTRREFFTSDGEFQFQALWDPKDEQTSEKREEFRDWTTRMARNMKFEVEQ